MLGSQNSIPMSSLGLWFVLFQVCVQVCVRGEDPLELKPLQEAEEVFSVPILEEFQSDANDLWIVTLKTDKGFPKGHSAAAAHRLTTFFGGTVTQVCMTGVVVEW